MNSAPVTLPCTSSTTATGACAAANPAKPTTPTIAANMLFIPEPRFWKVAINKRRSAGTIRGFCRARTAVDQKPTPIMV
jgi:hypothetical protein